MQKVLTAEQMREVDRLTTERYGIPSILLMENAAHAVARVITEKLGGSVNGKSILVLCGKGNNGGDGASLALKLALAGASVEVILFGKISEVKGDARANFDAAGHSVDWIREFESRVEWDEWLYRSRQGWDVVVDAIFGTGLSRPLDIWLGNIIRHINILSEGEHDPARLTVSVDLPSGLGSNVGAIIGESIQADLTVTFTAPKPANVLAPASSFNGELFIEDIGSPQELVNEFESLLFLAEHDDALNWFIDSYFNHDSYKNKRGQALVIAGSDSYSGAAVLCGNAAMRSGVGLVTIVTPRSSRDSVSSRVLPEVMVRGVSETEGGAIGEGAFAEIGDLLGKADAVAIGSGISQNESTRRFVISVVENRTQPVIIDADALNLLSPASTKWPSAHARGSDLILTPHEGEFMRLLGETKNHPVGERPPPLLGKEGSLKEDRVADVRDFAVKHNVILVLKGERVLIGCPDGRVVVNPTGNSGLGKAGNGDTLTGILAGFVAQAVKFEIDIFETVVAAVYVAGMAGDVAEKKYGKRVMTASDVRECLADVFAEFESK